MAKKIPGFSGSEKWPILRNSSTHTTIAWVPGLEEPRLVIHAFTSDVLNNRLTSKIVVKLKETIWAKCRVWYKDPGVLLNKQKILTEEIKRAISVEIER